MKPLSAQIHDLQKANEQKTSSLCEKVMLRDLLYNCIAPHFGNSGLYIIGSTLNSFGTNASDMDLCLMLTHQEVDQQSDAIHILKIVMKHLQKLKLIDKMDLIYAKVPILRATFHAPFDKTVVDLNVNNVVAIRNTHLLFYYSGFDWRVRPLISTIKEWAKRRGINNSSQSSFTSYSLVLMVIHYLQCGVPIPILPSLQSHYPDRFDAMLDFRELDISQPLTPIRNWGYARNHASLGDLLKGFFYYYSYQFDFDTSAISVRLGMKVDRAFVVSQSRNLHHLSQWRCICIEEPFTLSNAAHSVFDERVFETIKESFDLAYKALDQYETLESLFSMESVCSNDKES